jgi:hypothetical protein
VRPASHPVLFGIYGKQSGGDISLKVPWFPPLIFTQAIPSHSVITLPYNITIDTKNTSLAMP